MVVLGDSTTRGRISFSPSARLELLRGRVRRRLGCHRRGTPSVRSLVSKPKGTLHQPQGDDGIPGWPRVQLSSQRQDDHSLLRHCHDSRLPKAIGRNEVSGPVPRSEGDSPGGRLHEDHATSPVNPGVSLNTRADLLSRPNLVIGSEWALHQEVVQDLLRQWPAIIGLFAKLLTARLPVFFAPAWEPKAAGVDAFLRSSQTESLSPLRSHPDRPLLASKRMVSSSTGPSIRHSNRTTLTSRSAATTAFPSVSRQSPFASSDCVAPLKRFASHAGFSETVAGHLALRRRNSRLNCQVRWGKFRKWCRVFHHRSSEPTIPKIAEFLTFLFTTEKTAVSTIKDYRVMLSSVFKFCLQEISSSPILKDLVRSFEISAPPPLHHSPPWDLDKVLEYLSGPLLSLSRRFLSE